MFSLIISIGIIGCSNTKEEKSYDEEFIKSLATGLESRWKLTYEYDDLVSKGEIKETDVKKEIEYDEKYVQAELTNIEKYKDLKFEDSKLQEYAIQYINLLKKQQEGVELMPVNLDKGNKLWNEGYDQRSKLIITFIDEYDLPISDEYQKTVKEFRKASEQVKDNEKVEAAVEKCEFIVTSSRDGWKDYEAVIQNNTDTDYDFFNISINLLDDDEVILESTSAYVENWKAGQKARFKFTTNCDFSSMSKECEYQNFVLYFRRFLRDKAQRESDLSGSFFVVRNMTITLQNLRKIG